MMNPDPIDVGDPDPRDLDREALDVRDADARAGDQSQDQSGNQSGNQPGNQAGHRSAARGVVVGSRRRSAGHRCFRHAPTRIGPGLGDSTIPRGSTSTHATGRAMIVDDEKKTLGDTFAGSHVIPLDRCPGSLRRAAGDVLRGDVRRGGRAVDPVPVGRRCRLLAVASTTLESPVFAGPRAASRSDVHVGPGASSGVGPGAGLWGTATDHPPGSAA